MTFGKTNLLDWPVLGAVIVAGGADRPDAVIAGFPCLIQGRATPNIASEHRVFGAHLHTQGDGMFGLGKTAKGSKRDRDHNYRYITRSEDDVVRAFHDWGTKRPILLRPDVKVVTRH